MAAASLLVGRAISLCGWLLGLLCPRTGATLLLVGTMSGTNKLE